MINIFRTIIFPAISCLCMVKPAEQAPCDIKIGFYQLDEDYRERYLEALRVVQAAAQEDDIQWMGLGLSLTALERTKVPIFDRLARTILDARETNKVIILLNHLEPVQVLAGMLREYNPCIVDGSVSIAGRVNTIEKFQQPSTECRLLIGTVSANAVGIDLHDMNGEYPRFMFISPNYQIIKQHQASGRVCREGTKSPSVVRYVFSNTAGQQELSIIDTLAKASEFMSTMKKDNSVKYPSEHPQYHE